MRPLLLIAACAALAAGCSNPCRELGDRICQCIPVGTTVEACKQEVDNAVKAADPTSSQDEYCDQRLAECNAPDDVPFCDWIQTETGKQKCGLAYYP